MIDVDKQKRRKMFFYMAWRVFFFIMTALGALMTFGQFIGLGWVTVDHGEDDLHFETYTAVISGQTFERQEVEYRMIKGLPIFEGDIILDLGQNRVSEMGMVINRQNRLWPKGVIPYVIDPNLPDQFRIYDAIAHWEEKTPIRFVERTNERNYIVFQPSWGCSSYVGMVGGKQPINLALGCRTPATIHEIGHAVGLWHEQSRHDRDQYVTIHYENIQSGYAFNFNQQLTDGDDVGPYDYLSIMHYPRWAFSKNGKDTITPLQDYPIGEAKELSAGDIAAVEALYEGVVTGR